MGKGNGKTPDEQPVMDYSNVSGKWSKAMRASMQAATRATITMDRPIDPQADPATINALLDKKEAALTLLEEQAEVQAALIAQVLVSVPQSWLMNNAPPDLDWHDPASLEWVRPDHYNELLNLATSGQGVSDKAKN